MSAELLLERKLTPEQERDLADQLASFGWKVVRVAAGPQPGSLVLTLEPSHG